MLVHPPLQDDLTDPSAVYNKLNLNGFAQSMPHFNWTAYFTAMLARGDANVSLASITEIIVYAPAFFQRLDTLLAATSEADLRVGETVCVYVCMCVFVSVCM